MSIQEAVPCGIQNYGTKDTATSQLGHSKRRLSSVRDKCPGRHSLVSSLPSPVPVGKTRSKDLKALPLGMQKLLHHWGFCLGAAGRLTRDHTWKGSLTWVRTISPQPLAAPGAHSSTFTPGHRLLSCKVARPASIIS